MFSCSFTSCGHRLVVSLTHFIRPELASEIVLQQYLINEFCEKAGKRKTESLSSTSSALQYSATFRSQEFKTLRTKLLRNSYVQRVSKLSRAAVLTTSTARKLQLTTAEKSHNKPCEARGPVVINTKQPRINTTKQYRPRPPTRPG